LSNSKHLAGAFAGIGACNGRDDAIFGGLFGFGADIVPHQITGLRNRGIDQIPDDLFHVPPDITDFGKFRRLNLEERRAGQLGQPAADFGFANASGADHQNILWIDLVPQVIAQLFAAPTVA
jgi:hypothetical protein